MFVNFGVVLVGVFIINFEHISHLVLVFLMLTLNIVPIGFCAKCSGKIFEKWLIII